MKFAGAFALVAVGSVSAATVSSSLISQPAQATSSRFITPSGVLTSSLIITPSVSSSAPTTSTTAVPPLDPGTCLSAHKYYTWYRGQFRPECQALLDDCMKKTETEPFIWSKTSCVAAATCGGTVKLEQLERCRNPAWLTNDKTPHLSYNIYANIVGDCAWAQGGCPITKQKYIDWFYKALEAAGTQSWPTSAQSVIDNFWNPIKEWTATGETVPYVNFDDWLHFSASS